MTTAVQASRTSASAALLRLSKMWPPDPLRPELSFGAFLQARAEALSSTEGASPAAGKFGKSPIDAQVRALQDLASGKVSQKYRLTDKLLRPPAMPEYYEELVKELAAVPTRTWWQRMVNSYKGFFGLK